MAIFNNTISMKRHYIDAMTFNIQVMVVDDAKDARAIVRSLLMAVGIPRKNITVVDSGTTAIDLLVFNPYDVVFLDINMPTIDGLTTGKVIKLNFPNTKVIGVSSNRADDVTPLSHDRTCKETKLKGYYSHTNQVIDGNVLADIKNEEVFDDYVQKPFSRDQFSRVISRFFKKENDLYDIDI